MLLSPLALLPPSFPNTVYFSPIKRILSLIYTVALLALWDGSPIQAQYSGENNRQNQNNREFQNTNPAVIMMREMQSSLKQLPWNDLSPAAQTKIKRVVGGVPLFRRLPSQTVYADPEIYQFLLNHPDLVIGFWEHLGATQLSLREVKENQFFLKEASGTTASVEVLHRTNDLCIVYAKGEYRGALLPKPYQGEVVLILRTQFMRDSSQEPMVVCHLDSFVQINSIGADILAKIFYTSLAKTADSNFELTVAFISQASKAASHNAGAIKGTAEEVATIRQEVCEEFCEVVDRVAFRYAKRNSPTTTVRPQQENRQPNSNHDFLTSQFSKSDVFNDDPFFASPKGKIGKNAGELEVPKTVESASYKKQVPRLPKPVGDDEKLRINEF